MPMPKIPGWKGQVGDCCRRNYFTLSFGQLILVGGYIAGTIACFIVGAQLTQNSNRPGMSSKSSYEIVCRPTIS